jgi:hypothetical protein
MLPFCDNVYGLFVIEVFICFTSLSYIVRLQENSFVRGPVRKPDTFSNSANLKMSGVIKELPECLLPYRTASFQRLLSGQLLYRDGFQISTNVETISVSCGALYNHRNVGKGCKAWAWDSPWFGRP